MTRAVLTTFLLTAYADATTQTPKKPVTDTNHGTAVTDGHPARSGTSALFLASVTSAAVSNSDRASRPVSR
jgi:hypothetical protein